MENNGKKVEERCVTELTTRKKKGRGKVATGISLMETFTANNVKKSRLTVCVPLLVTVLESLSRSYASSSHKILSSSSSKQDQERP